MKFVLAVALAIVASANAGQVIDPEHDYMYFPDGNGNSHLIDLKEKVEDFTGHESDNAILARNLDTILFHLYTKEDPANPHSLILNSVSSVKESNFLSSRPTRFVTHGWRSSEDSNSVVVIRDAYLAAGDYNVITIDWNSFAGTVYLRAAPRVPAVAARVAEMIDFLSENAGLDLTTTKLIGHSLGAHVSGIAARLAKGTIEAVIGLDPALPTFERAGAGERLHQTDADYVQVIHTNGGLLGIMDPIGDTDFYPNGGRSQPGCGIDLFGFCAHVRAYHYFAESILNPTGFSAVGLRSSNINTLSGVSGVFMGGRSFNTDVRGSFTLITGRQSPYALG